MIPEHALPPEYENAPQGQAWVCVACGRFGKDRTRLGDTSCFSNAVLCYVEFLDGSRRVKACKFVEAAD